MKSKNILQDLNPQQKEAVTTTEGPLLIIAGAGTGKTTVIARRIAYIIEKKLAKPAEILALTFTDKAAGEMEERVDQLVPYGFIDTWISTFHAFGDRVLRDNAIDIGLSPNFKVFSRPQQVLFFQQNLFRFQLDYFRPLANPTKFISAILSFFSRLKDENVSPVKLVQYAKGLTTKAKSEEEKMESIKYNELAVCFESYEKFKDEAGFMDFGDQVVKTINLFKDRPQILKSYQEQFKFVLVDEYQDTNYSQNELVKILASAHQNICVVGDDDQSIYKFRGAAIANILDFVKNFPKTKQVVLTQNYRSTQKILDSAYKLICHNNPDRLEVKNKINKKLVAMRKDTGEAVTEIISPTISEEADAVAGQIEKMSATSKKQKEKSYSYKDFAVLIRANSSADHFLRALNMKGIPYKYVGASGLYQQEEISLLISFLTAISNFEDSLNLFNLITSNLYSLPPQEAIKIASYARKKTRSFWQIAKNLQDIDESELNLSADAKEIVEKLINDLEESINLSTKQNVGRVTYDFLKRTNYLVKLEKENTIEAQIKIQNIAKFFDKIKEFENVSNIETVSQFVDYLEAIREAGDDPATVEFDPDTDAVNVMTIHSAKGLEFPVVFMVNLTSDSFPTRARREAIEVPKDLIGETLPVGDWHLEEERRLFYVGQTRAKDLLYFSHSKDTGGRRIKKISPFVLEALDKTKIRTEPTKLTSREKIEQFAPSPQKHIQTAFFDVDVLKLTQGSLDDYLTCAYKYRYIHILKIPILRHHAIVYGSAIHAAVAQFNRVKKQGKNIALTDLLEVFENAWDSEGFLTTEHEKQRKNQGKLALTEFWRRESKSKELPSFIESGFKFSLAGVTLVGRFDRVDVKQGSKIEIIDYKSSENIDQDRANAQAKESIQLSIYALYYWKRHKIIPQKVSLYFLETGIIGSHIPTLKELEKTEKLIQETTENINRDRKNNQFAANPKYFGREPACVYCAYKSICRFSQAK